MKQKFFLLFLILSFQSSLSFGVLRTAIRKAATIKVRPRFFSSESFCNKQNLRLISAAKKGDDLSFKRAHRKGADLTQIDISNKNYTALHYFCQIGSREGVSYLIDNCPQRFLKSQMPSKVKKFYK